MAENKCPKDYSWCDLHSIEGDGPGDHRKAIGFGIEFYRHDDEDDTYINWMPDFSEWLMRTGQVRGEMRELRSTLSLLPDVFDEFVRETSGQPAPVESVWVSQPCLDRDCRHEYHEWLNGVNGEACALAPIKNEHGWFIVHADRPPDSTQWNVWVDACDLPDGDEVKIAIAALAASVEQMQLRVDEINQAVRS